MIIKLSELPESGQNFICNRKTGEFNEVLQDLIIGAPYQLEFLIKPLGQSFEMTGFIRTEMPENCSRCAIDMKLPVFTRFHELLREKEYEPRNSHYTKPNHFSDMTASGPSLVEYQGDIFDMGEYIHELVALETPFVPAPPEDEKGDCSLCGIKVQGRDFGYNEAEEKLEKATPFSVLKNIKIN